MEKLRSFLQRTLGTVRHHVGTDQFGNKYFYIPEQKSLTGQKVKARRLMQPIDKDLSLYKPGSIPMEWEAWIRGKRKEPPTIEEILKNEQIRQEMNVKVQELIEKEKLQATEDIQCLKEPNKTKIVGHASATTYGKHTPSEEPTSTAGTFEPGSWNPQKK